METIIEKIKEKNNEADNKLEDLKEILYDYFGEENVDITINLTEDDDENYLYNVLIHFPEVEVTNEHDESILLNHLWVKIKLTVNITIVGTFTINKSEYQLSHFISRYIFSHVMKAEYDNLEEFKVPCLGSGPIRNTIASLQLEYDRPLWQLFCVELDKYIHTESIEGIPYVYLKDATREVNITVAFARNRISIANYNAFVAKNYFEGPLYKEFIKDFIRSKKLKFNFTNGNYGIAMSYVNLVFTISNHFIDWFNRKGKDYTNKACLYSDKVLLPVTIKNGLTIDILNSTNPNNINDYIEYEDTPLFDFKSNTIKLHIVDDSRKFSNIHPLILNPLIIDMIITRILTIINYKYNKDGINTQTICIV